MNKLAAGKPASLLVLVVLALGVGAQAQRGFYWWPQLNTYIGLSDQSQLEFIGSGSVNPDAPNQQLVLGPSLSFFFAPFPLPKIKTLNRSKNNYLEFRVGYRYVETLGARSSHTHRGLIELTPRFPLPGQMVVADRNQLVLIGAAKQVTWLYRNRVTLERSFEAHSLIFTPYLQAQVIYHGDPGSWNYYNCGGGSIFRLTSHVQIDGYYQHHGFIGLNSRPINGIGLKVELYLHNIVDD